MSQRQGSQDCFHVEFFGNAFNLADVGACAKELRKTADKIPKGMMNFCIRRSRR